MKRFFALSALALLAPALAAPAHAEAAPPPPRAAIAIGDLDLASAKGQQQLALRVHRAAEIVCAAEALASLPQTIRARRQCIRQAKASARAMVEAVITQRAGGKATG